MTARLADLGQPVARRSLALSLAGALLGVMLALATLARNGAWGNALPIEDAATVNGVPLLMSDLLAQTPAGSASPLATRRRVLDAMIADELRVQHGLELGGARRNSLVRAALVQATEGQMVADAMATVPAPDELRAWYAAHRAAYADPGYMKVREYVLPTAEAAARAVAALRSGRSASALGLRDSGRLQGEDELYFAARLHLGPQLFALAERMVAGQVSDPVHLPDGEHVLAMIYNKGPRPYDFEVAAPRVRSDFLTDKTSRLQRAGEHYLRKRADIRIADELR